MKRFYLACAALALFAGTAYAADAGCTDVISSKVTMVGGQVVTPQTCVFNSMHQNMISVAAVKPAPEPKPPCDHGPKDDGGGDTPAAT